MTIEKKRKVLRNYKRWRTRKWESYGAKEESESEARKKAKETIKGEKRNEEN